MVVKCGYGEYVAMYLDILQCYYHGFMVVTLQTSLIALKIFFYLPPSISLLRKNSEVIGKYFLIDMLYLSDLSMKWHMTSSNNSPLKCLLYKTNANLALVSCLLKLPYTNIIMTSDSEVQY